MKQKEVIVETLLTLDSEADFAQLLAEAGSIFDRCEGVADEEEPLFLDEGEAYKGLTEEVYEMERECVEEY